MNAAPQSVVLVTGPSGAGRTTTIHVLEDIGFETIDNIPLSLVPRLLDGLVASQPMALGIDVRNRDFSVQALLELYEQLKRDPGLSLELIYLDCAQNVLLRRYSETRRRHPLSPDTSPSEGIKQELALLEPVRDVADTLIDTTELSPHDLRDTLQDRFDVSAGAGLAVSLHSFSYKRGLPQGADMVFDCRFLTNPHWDPALRHMTGLDREVVDYIAKDGRFEEFRTRVVEMLKFLLPAYRDEGKAHFSVAFGCTGGQHRSVAVTEIVARALAESGWRVSIRHREAERRTNWRSSTLPTEQKDALV